MPRSDRCAPRADEGREPRSPRSPQGRRPPRCPPAAGPEPTGSGGDSGRLCTWARGIRKASRNADEAWSIGDRMPLEECPRALEQFAAGVGHKIVVVP
ncbi:hypothetical protein [Streptomyces sp. NBC_01334]|uniref:hypothetical protein n=1 Tax=Streptomyces sp. NBC_01334 TaxID=2903827 RepID=UPI002E0EAA73|nr:hypothetical protein OG736_11595 [Streptomyces sp. NBC_01334]